jgi:hypothetical protein
VSVHIETIDAESTVVEVNVAGAEIGEDTYDKPTLVFSDLDTALVISGDRHRLEHLLSSALMAVQQLNHPLTARSRRFPEKG